MIEHLLPTHRFIPYDVLPSVKAIDLNALKSSGFKGVIFDVDNTLIPYDDRAVKPWHQALFTELERLGLKTMMLTNNHHQDVKDFADACGIDVILSANKPLKRGYRKALKRLNLKPSETMMVGDQFMTDLYGASKVGMPTILVPPIKRKSEKWYTKLLRRLERAMKEKVTRAHPELTSKLIEIHDA